MEEVRDMMGDHPVYISFDIDALDPSFAPGTGKYNKTRKCVHEN
jgi:arginase family enzyme